MRFRGLVVTMIANLLLVSPAAAGSCNGSGLSARCKVDGRAWRAENGGGAWSVSSPSGSSGDMRFEVRSGDVAPWDASHAHLAERSEISDFDDKAPVDADIWFSFGMMVEPGAPVTSRWLVLGQLHGTKDPGTTGGSPPWALLRSAWADRHVAILPELEALLRTITAAAVQVTP